MIGIWKVEKRNMQRGGDAQLFRNNNTLLEI